MVELAHVGRPPLDQRAERDGPGAGRRGGPLEFDLKGLELGIEVQEPAGA